MSSIDGTSGTSPTGGIPPQEVGKTEKSPKLRGEEAPPTDNGDETVSSMDELMEKYPEYAQLLGEQMVNQMESFARRARERTKRENIENR